MSIIRLKIKSTGHLQDLLSLRILFNLEYPIQFTYIFLLAEKSIEWIAHVFFLSLFSFSIHVLIYYIQGISQKKFSTYNDKAFMPTFVNAV